MREMMDSETATHRVKACIRKWQVFGAAHPEGEAGIKSPCLVDHRSCEIHADRLGTSSGRCSGDIAGSRCDIQKAGAGPSFERIQQRVIRLRCQIGIYEWYDWARCSQPRRSNALRASSSMSHLPSPLRYDAAPRWCRREG